MPLRTLAAFASLAFALSGCGTPAAPTRPAAADAGPDAVAAARAKLGPDDLALVEAQEWCAVATGNRLGSMDVPVKVSVKGQPVFLCCKGCAKRVEADPDGTLATVAALKEKAKAKPPAP